MKPSPEITPLEKVQEQIANGLRYARKAAAQGGDDAQVAQALDYGSRRDALVGDMPMSTTAKGMQPIHVLMCYMLAAGRTVKEIAEATGYSYAAVYSATKQPWFRERFLDITKEAGLDAVQAFVKGECIRSLETLVEMRDNIGNKGSERISAANSILDRALGKPAVYVKSESSLNLSTAADTKDEIERQLSAIQGELNSRGVRIANGSS